MRVVGRDGRDERGAVLIIFAVFVLVAVIFLAFVVDIGNQRQDRRQLTTATDAAALDVAKQWADNNLDPLPSFTFVSSGVYGCDTAALPYLAANRVENPEGYSCEATFVHDQLATVSVFADDTTQYEIGPAFGVDSGGIGSRTAVRMTSGVGGALRPFTICAYDSVELETWLNTGGAAVTDIIVGGPKFLSSNCGQNNANWGFIAFPSQDGGTPGLAESLAGGAIDPIASIDKAPSSGDAEVECVKSYDTQLSDLGAAVCLFEATGTNGWTSSLTTDEFELLWSNQNHIHFPVYDEVLDLGGSGSGFPIRGFVEAQILAYCGNPATPEALALEALNACNGGNDNYLHLRLYGFASGDCCGITDTNANLQICDVGTLGGGVASTFADDCQTSDGSGTTPTTLPPAPDPCTVVSVTPATALVAVVGSGSNYQLAAPAVFQMTVQDAGDCVGPTAIANGPGSDPAATVTGPVANVYAVTFPAGTRFQRNKSYTIEISDDGAVIDNSAILTTVG